MRCRCQAVGLWLGWHLHPPGSTRQTDQQHSQPQRVSTAWLMAAQSAHKTADGEPASNDSSMGGYNSRITASTKQPPGHRSTSVGRTSDTQARSLTALVDTLQQLGMELEGTRQRSGSTTRPQRPGEKANPISGILGGAGRTGLGGAWERDEGRVSEHNAMLDMASAQLEQLKERLSQTLAKSANMSRKTPARASTHQQRSSALLDNARMRGSSSSTDVGTSKDQHVGTLCSTRASTAQLKDQYAGTLSSTRASTAQLSSASLLERVTAAPQAGSTSYPERGAAVPRHGGTSYPERGAAAMQAVSTSYPERGAAAIQAGSTSCPERGAAVPQHGGTSYPERGAAVPQHGGTSYPERGAAAMQAGSTSYPERRAAVPQHGGTSYPERGAVAMQPGGTSYPERGAAAMQPGGTSYPERGAVATQAGSTTLPERRTDSSGGWYKEGIHERGGSGKGGVSVLSQHSKFSDGHTCKGSAYTGSVSSTSQAGSQFLSSFRRSSELGAGAPPVSSSRAVGHANSDAPVGSSRATGQANSDAPGGSSRATGQANSDVPSASSRATGQANSDAPGGSSRATGQANSDVPSASSRATGQANSDAPGGSSRATGQANSDVPSRYRLRESPQGIGKFRMAEESVGGWKPPTASTASTATHLQDSHKPSTASTTSTATHLQDSHKPPTASTTSTATHLQDSHVQLMLDQRRGVHQGQLPEDPHNAAPSRENASSTRGSGGPEDPHNAAPSRDNTASTRDSGGPDDPHNAAHSRDNNASTRGSGGGSSTRGPSRDIASDSTFLHRLAALARQQDQRGRASHETSGGGSLSSSQVLQEPSHLQQAPMYALARQQDEQQRGRASHETSGGGSLSSSQVLQEPSHRQQSTMLSPAPQSVAEVPIPIPPPCTRCADLSIKLQGQEAELAASSSELADSQSQLADCRGQLAGCQGQLAEARNQLAGCRNQLAESQDELADCQGQLAESRNQLADCQGQLAGCRNQLAESKDQLAVSRNQLAESQGQLSDYQEQLARDRNQLAECKSQLAEFCKQEEEQTQALSQTHEALESLGKEYADKVHRLERKLHRLYTTATDNGKEDADKGKEYADKVHRLEKELHRLYSTATGNVWSTGSQKPLGTAAGTATLETGGSEDIGRLMSALDQKVGQLVDSCDQLEKENSKFKESVGRIRQHAARKEFELSTAVAEAESQRDKLSADSALLKKQVAKERSQWEAAVQVPEEKSQWEAAVQESQRQMERLRKYTDEMEVKESQRQMERLRKYTDEMEESQRQMERLRKYTDEVEVKLSSQPSSETQGSTELRSEVATLRRQLGIISRQARDSHSLREELDEVKESAREMETALQSAKAACAHVEADLKLAQAEVAKHVGVLAERDASSDTLKGDLKQALDRLEDLSRRNSALREQLLRSQTPAPPGAEGAAPRVAGLESECTALTRQRDQTRGQLDACERKLAAALAKEADLQRRLLVAEGAVKMAECEVGSAKAQGAVTTGLQERLQQAERELSSAKAQEVLLLERLQVADGDLSSALAQGAAIQGRLAACERKLAAATAQEALLNSRSQQLVLDVAEVQEELQVAEQKLAQAQAALKGTEGSDKRQVAQLQLELKAAEQKLAQAAGARKAAEDSSKQQVEQLQQELQAAGQKLWVAEQKLGQAALAVAGESSDEQQVAQLQQGLKAAGQKLALLKESEGSVKELVGQLQQQVAQLQQEVSQLKESGRTDKQQVARLQQELTSVQGKLVGAREKLQRQAVQAPDVAAAAAAASADTLRDLEEKLSIKETEVVDLRDMLTEYEGAIGLLEQELQGAQAKGQSAARDVGRLQSELRSSAARCTQLEGALTALKGQTNRDDGRVVEMEAELRHTQQQVVALSEKLSVGKSENGRLMYKLREKEGELMQADGKVQVLRAEVHRLQALESF
eukprot:gene7227-335_t